MSLYLIQAKVGRSTIFFRKRPKFFPTLASSGSVPVPYLFFEVDRGKKWPRSHASLRKGAKFRCAVWPHT